jgi:exodeoxyribonuclease-3
VGWRIDYQIATPALAERAVTSAVDRAPSYAERWSDHAPLVVDFRL